MRKGVIILSGGGDIDTTFEIDKKYFELLKNNSRILYVPIALNRDWQGFEACYDWFSKVIAKHQKNKELDFTMILERDQVPDLDSFDSIYIGGGNTFKLLDYINEKKLAGKLKEYFKQGGIIYGGSAGAIILGKDIRTVIEENDKNYRYVQGLDLVKGMSVICHYTESLDAKLIEYERNYAEPVMALPEGSGIILENDVMQSVGSVFFFNKTGKKMFI